MAKLRALRNITLGSDLYAKGEEYDEKDIDPAIDIEGDFEPVEPTKESDSEDGDEDTDEEVDLSKMSRAELDEYAVEHTNVDPSEYRTKGALVEAIEEELA